MVYNAVECCNTAAVYEETEKALPPGRALFVIPEGELIMAVSYKKLWKLLIDKDIKKKDLVQMAGLSSYTLNKLNKGENVNAETLMKICVALDCSFDDIMEIIHEAE